MKNILEFMRRSSLPSDLKNPFAKNRIKAIHVHYSCGYFNKSNWTASGKVEFENGLTKGEQKFDGDTFDEVVQKIKAFIEQLD
jgi:hypothetical protein